MEFVPLCKEERDALFATYSSPGANSTVSRQLELAALEPEQRRAVLAAIDLALTDAFYTLLMGLSGAASLGGVYRLIGWQMSKGGRSRRPKTQIWNSLRTSYSKNVHRLDVPRERAECPPWTKRCQAGMSQKRTLAGSSLGC